jgi:hypothetical protein
MIIKIESSPESRITLKQKQSRIGAGFAYHESSQSFHRLKILLRNLEGIPEVYLNRKPKFVYNIPSLISTISRIEKSGSNIANLHSGAVVNKKGEGIIFSAWQDVGKTTLALRLSTQGYSLIGDDGIELKSDGTISRTQNKTGIFPHKDNVKKLNLPIAQKLLALLKFYFVRFSFMGKLINPNLWVDYKYFPNVSEQGPLSRAYILERGQNNVAEIGLEYAVNRILSTTFAQILPDGFPKRFIMSYCFANNLSPSLLQDNYRKIVTSALSGAKIYKISGEDHEAIYRQFLEHESKYTQ